MSNTPQSIQQHNAEQLAYYDGAKKPNMVPVESSPYLERHVDEVVKALDLTPNDRILEVGCGMGRYTLLMAKRGLNVEGLDLSDYLLKELRRHDGGRHNIPLHHTDLIDHPAELKGAFDAVVGFFMLHHVHDLELVFKAVVDLLKPGGRTAFIEPNPYNPLYYIQMLVTPGMTWKGDKGIVNMRPKKIIPAMASRGFEQVALKRFGFFPPFVSNTAGGAKVEKMMERPRILRPFGAFQLFKGMKKQHENG
ncbi:MAG: class I SAM-dependent methyltransferase [Candidatus Aquicultorales bacterium]